MRQAGLVGTPPQDAATLPLRTIARHLAPGLGGRAAAQHAAHGVRAVTVDSASAGQALLGRRMALLLGCTGAGLDAAVDPTLQPGRAVDLAGKLAGV